jgi:hypothetical protein
MLREFAVAALVVDYTDEAIFTAILGKLFI